MRGFAPILLTFFVRKTRRFNFPNELYLKDYATYMFSRSVFFESADRIVLQPAEYLFPGRSLAKVAPPADHEKTKTTELIQKRFTLLRRKPSSRKKKIIAALKQQGSHSHGSTIKLGLRDKFIFAASK